MSQIFQTVSCAADAASVTATVMGAVPAGLVIAAISAGNGFVSFKLCKPTASHLTALGVVTGVVPGFDKVSIGISIIDIGLNAAGY